MPIYLYPRELKKMDEDNELQKLNVTFKLFGLPNQVGRTIGFRSNPFKFWMSDVESIQNETPYGSRYIDKGDICFKIIEELIDAANKLITNRATNGSL